MAGYKRRALTTDIDMNPEGGNAPSLETDATTMSITTVTIPASKRVRASRKSRRHEDLPIASSTPPPTLEPSSSGSATLDPSENTNINPTTDGEPDMDVDEEIRASETNDHADVYIGDEDTRNASVRRFHPC